MNKKYEKYARSGNVVAKGYGNYFVDRCWEALNEGTPEVSNTQMHRINEAVQARQEAHHVARVLRHGGAKLDKHSTSRR